MKSFHVFTCGDINGIGPEISIKVFNKIFRRSKNTFLIYLCPDNVFKESIELITPEFDYVIHNNENNLLTHSGLLNVLNIGSFRIDKGIPTKESGEASLASIYKALYLFEKGGVKSIITSPISKQAVKSAGSKFPGHTELFAGHFGVENFAMFFLSKKFHASLITIHEPIKKISSLLSIEKVKAHIELINFTLKNKFKVDSPRIALLGLNPHAGEGGDIGAEEEQILLPAIKLLKHINVSGPYVPDAFFTDKKYRNFDHIVGVYHDQILIPFKMLNFNTGVNYTAGLPVVRTSPDHGTAYDIAWKNQASAESLFCAYLWAKKISGN